MYEIGALNAQHINAVMAIENASHTHPWSEKLMLSCMSGRYFATGLFLGTELVAFYIAEQAGLDITLMDICVAPTHQGQGLSKLLMKDLIVQSQQKGAELMFLEVRESNAVAINLYQGCGFDCNGRRKNYYPDGENALLMMKSLLAGAEL